MIVPVFLPHLGCGDRCIYCDQMSITDLRTNNMEATVAAHLGSVRQPIEVGLFGGNIFGLKADNLRRLFAFFEPHRDRIVGFRISTKPVPLGNEIIRILKENGVRVIELGIPSFNDGILRVINRRHTAEDLRRSFLRLREEGFTMALQTMVGLPGETMTDIAETTEHLATLAPDYVRIYPLAVLKGTPLETMYREGTFVPIPFEKAVERTLYIYLHLLKKGIKVVKMGLTDNEVISDRIIAGHFHPSFGYIVKSWAFRLALVAKLRSLSVSGGPTKILLNHRDIPHLLGYKRKNMAEYGKEGFSIEWETREITQGTFVIELEGRAVEGDVFDALSIAAVSS
ncbi:MAG: radical SAM protein [Syntrophobacterales bacterium]|jgi:histone acetyltransferase (RNA polymerase elongator complex component)|nr:radical SAM protein [Syntrophobacterales bacterium]